jgi:Yip1 domain
MATTSMPAPEAQAAISPIGRIVGVFFSPKSTFEDIGRKPSWIAPVVLMTVLGLCVAVAMNQRIDWRDIASRRIEESSRASQLSAEQKQQQIDISAKVSPYITYAFGTIGPTLAVLIVGAVMLGAYNLIGGVGASYKVSMGIVAHAYVVTIVSSLLFILILFLKPPGTVDVENPVAANLGAFLPDGSAKWLVSLCSSIDLFSFWTLILIAIGFAAFNAKKLKGAKTFTIAFSVWAVFVVVKVAIAWVFS